MRPCALLLATLLPLPATAGPCGVDLAAVEARIAELAPAYGDVPPGIGCDAPANAAGVMLCDSARSADPELWRMARLDDMAWVLAVENATGAEVDHANPPRDAGFDAVRDACTTGRCLCDALIGHTGDSLGGMSPYLR